MRDVHQGPDRDQGRSLPSTSALAAPAPELSWNEPAAVRQWLSILRDQVLDGLAIGEDATRRARRRLFSRHEARRRVRAAEREVMALLGMAERGLARASAGEGGSHG